MAYHFKITGHTLVERIGYMPADHTDYELVVSFERWEDNRETLENFVTWYWNIDLEKNPSERWRLLCEEHCARALAVFHFRGQSTGFQVQSVAHVPSAPLDKPTTENHSFKLWITSEVRKDVFTSLNAGWELYCRCKYGKISVTDAKAFVRENFPGTYFSWNDVLRAFGKQGGRYTDKYLRVD